MSTFTTTSTSSTTTYVSHEIRDHFFRKIRSLAGNRMCFDCNRRNPTWATVSFGVFLCLDCSGYHRRLGVHISFVRSTDMDEWTEEQLKIMQIGGNHEARKFLKQHGVIDMTNIEEKYRSKAAQLYRTMLAKNVKNPAMQLIKLEEQTTVKENDVDGLDALMKGLGTTNGANNSSATVIAAPTSTQIPNMPPAPTYATTSSTTTPSTALPQIVEPVKVVEPVIFASQPAISSQSTPAMNFPAQSKAQKLSSAVKLQGDFDFDDVPIENPPVSTTPSITEGSKNLIEQQIKDDEALAKALQEAEIGGFDDTFRSRSLSSLGTQPAFVPQAVPKENLNKYKDAKSISSDNYFSSEQQGVDTTRLNQFSGAQSISSDAYYGRESTSTDAVDEAAYQISQLKNVLGDKAGKIKNLTSSFFNDLQNRYT